MPGGKSTSSSKGSIRGCRKTLKFPLIPPTVIAFLVWKNLSVSAHETAVLHIPPVVRNQDIFATSWFGGLLVHDRAVPSSGRDFGCDALRMQRGAHGFVALLRLAE